MPKQLNSRGIAHFVLPLFIILFIGVAGTYALVSSHADSKNATTCKEFSIMTARGCKKWKYDPYKRMSGSMLAKVKAAASADNGGICNGGKELKFVYLNKQSWLSQFGDDQNNVFDMVSIENTSPTLKDENGKLIARAFNGDTLANVAFIGAGDPKNAQNPQGKQSSHYCQVYVYEDRLIKNWQFDGWRDGHVKLGSYMCILMSHEVGHLDGKIHTPKDKKNIMYPQAQSIMGYYGEGYKGSNCYRNEAFGVPWYPIPYVKPVAKKPAKPKPVKIVLSKGEIEGMCLGIANPKEGAGSGHGVTYLPYNGPEDKAWRMRACKSGAAKGLKDYKLSKKTTTCYKKGRTVQVQQVCDWGRTSAINKLAGKYGARTIN